MTLEKPVPKKMAVPQERCALILVDVQPDFMPGGALPVPEGKEILGPARTLMESEGFGLLVATQDWHPQGHSSFASSHPGRKPMDIVRKHGHEQILWPDHCVEGTGGARLHPDLPWNRIGAIIRKGMDPDSDSYSGFRNNWNQKGERPPTGLEGLLKSRGITDVFICGLARDFCVKWTAEDAAAANFTTWLFWDVTRPVDPKSDDHVQKGLISRGVHVIYAG